MGLEDLPCLACHRDLLRNGAIVELALFCQKRGLRWRVLGGWLAEFLGISDDDLPSEQKTSICTHESGFKARQSGQEQEKK